MKKIKDKYLFHILAFLIPIILILIFLIVIKIGFKGVRILSNAVLMADMRSQYLPLMQYFSNVLHGKDSLIYSFSNSLGGNMISTYAYYLASPLNLLLCFATPTNITIIVLMLILIKFGLCGLTMYIFLNHKISNNKYNALIISIFYSLMAYNVSYYFNTMWIDAVYLLPLVLYGIDDIITNKKITKYVIFLSLSIFSNFYISYMVAIFAVIYFISEMICNFEFKDKEKIYKCIKLFIISSLLSGMICSVILIPTILDMRNMIRASASNSMYIRDNIYESFLMTLSKLFALPNGKENVLSSYTPNVYFGLLPLIFSISYFFSKEKFKNKISALIIICFFLLSFSTNFFNLLWHGLSFPNGYAYRFSFLFSFFMLYLAYKGMCNKSKLNISKFIFLICILIFIGLIQIANGSNICFSFINIVVTIVFLTLYYILIKIKFKKIINVLISILIIIELELLLNNSFITTKSFGYIDNYNKYYASICESAIKYKDKNYKIDNKIVLSVVDSFSCSDYRLSNGLTTNHGDLYKFLNNNGFVSTYSMVTNADNTPVIYSLLGINYYYDFDDTNNIVEKTKYYEGNEEEYIYLYVHYNPYALPFGYIINSDYDSIFKESDKDNPFEYQNALLKSMSGIRENSLKPYELERKDKKNYKLYINNDKDIYFYLKHDIPENEKVFSDIITLNGKDKYKIDIYMSGVFKIINDYYGITNVEISSNDDYYYNSDDVLNFYYFDEELFKKQIETLKEKPFIVSEKSKNNLVGNIELEEEGILFLSIPYEDGFDIEVDGKKTDYLKLYDSFVGLKINKGNHEVKIKFKLPGLRIGLLMSISGIILLILYIRKLKKNN
ncbi:MAG: YfhO family protein [Bacilli bacterium]|nr:YfhO family protein [Bacilli bacterium]